MKERKKKKKDLCFYTWLSDRDCGWEKADSVGVRGSGPLRHPELQLTEPSSATLGVVCLVERSELRGNTPERPQ